MCVCVCVYIYIYIYIYRYILVFSFHLSIVFIYLVIFYIVASIYMWPCVSNTASLAGVIYEHTLGKLGLSWFIL